MEGKVIIVTGTSHGIGLATSTLLLSQGAKVLGIDLNAAPQPLTENKSFAFFQCDLTAPAAAEKAVAACLEAFGGRIDALLNVAGIMDHFSSVDTLEDDVWDRVIAVDLTAPVKLMRAVVKVMLKQPEGGSIVNVASRAAQSGAAAGVAYSSAKAGLVGATRQVAFRFRSEKIRCNAIAPGAVNSNMAVDFQKFDMAAFPACNQARVAAQPDELIVMPEQVASLLSYLASDASSGMTGLVVPIDNGWNTV